MPRCHAKFTVANGGCRFRGTWQLLLFWSLRKARRASYFTAPKRLSNEFGGTIGAEPET
jgi:hypothetical protein